jgi:hypothetical protein
MNTVPPEVNTPVNNSLSITDKVSNLTGSAVDGVSNLTGSAVDGVSEFANGAVDGVSEFANGAFNGVSEFANGAFNGVSSFVDSAGYYTGLSSKEKSVENPPQMPIENPQQQGGRGLGLTYYATPVNGLRVAEPTYMEYYKGGKRRRTKRNTKRRTRRCKSKRCKKTCRKQHRHKRK